MWRAKHERRCSDKFHFRVVEVVTQIYDAYGAAVDDGHLNPQDVRAEFATCGAKATWVVRLAPGEAAAKKSGWRQMESAPTH